MDTDSSKAASEYYGRIVVSDAESHCLHNRPSIQHTYNWTADYFDLNDNTVHTGTELYIADQKYNAGDIHWSINITLHPFFTMEAQS